MYYVIKNYLLILFQEAGLFIDEEVEFVGIIVFLMFTAELQVQVLDVYIFIQTFCMSVHLFIVISSLKSLPSEL